MATIQEFMTAEQQEAYGFAAGLSAAKEANRSAWINAVDALRAAEAKAISQYTGEVKTNRFGRPHGGVHPALVGLSGYFDLRGCYASE